MTRTYQRGKCWLCGMEISVAGAARVSHMRAHVRRGEAVEIKTRYGFRFRSTGQFEQKKREEGND